jgi:hypothetical protein
MYLLITHITLLLLIPTVGAIAVYGYATIDKGREERPPSPKRDGGASATQSSSPRPSPSPAAPELVPRPRDPLPGPAATAAALLFLPPAMSLVHPTPPCTFRPRYSSSSPLPARVVNCFWVVEAMALLGVLINVLPCVTNWVADIERSAAETVRSPMSTPVIRKNLIMRKRKAHRRQHSSGTMDDEESPLIKSHRHAQYLKLW